MTIGGRIKILRGKESRAEFSKKFDLSSATLERYENDKRVPDTEFITRLCNAYRVSADWLILGKGNKSAVINQAYKLLSNEPTLIRPKAADWAQMLSHDYFDYLWDKFRNRTEPLKGWLQLEIISRFPEFVEWLDKHQEEYGMTLENGEKNKLHGSSADFINPEE